MIPTSLPMHATRDDSSAGGRLVSRDGRELPLKGAELDVRAAGGIARTTVIQRFVNPYDEPLAVRYQLPLPAEGAVSGFTFVVGGCRIVGRVDEKQHARELYERAIVDGRSAALLEQERASSFTQDIGNIPPRAEVIAELVVDQKLVWTGETGWEWRFPTVVAPRYLGAAGRVPDAAKIAVDVADGELAPRVQLRLGIDEPLASGARPESPSHALLVRSRPRGAEVSLRSEDGARLDRDVVVRWRVAGDEVKTQLAVSKSAGGSYGLLSLLPPARFLPERELPRDLVLLLDTSGSMHGEPLEQARRVCLALVDSLGPRDSLGMIEFSSAPRSWRAAPALCDEPTKRDARAWLGALSAGGATEMHSAILAALDTLRPDAQRQVVVVSDGLIGFEQEVVSAILERLPPSSRVHTVGVGSAPNRSLTEAAARAGRGHEAIIGIGEDPEPVARRLVAHTSQPLVVELELGGSALVKHHPERLPDLFAGAPALISLELSPAGGEFEIRGRSAAGSWRHTLEVPASREAGAMLEALFAREAVADLEMRRGAGHSGIDERITMLGIRHQIATRLTSWVAVSEVANVDPRHPSRREVIPQELPFGMSVERLGLRAPEPPIPRRAMAAMPASYAAPMDSMRPPPPPAAAPAAPPPALGRAAPPRRAGKKAAEADDLMCHEDGAALSDLLHLSGRVVLSGSGRLVIEIVLPDPLEWDPADAVLTLVDGSTLEVTVDPASTTGPGSYPAGVSLRLTLAFPTPELAGAPRSVTLNSGEQVLVVTW